MAAKEGLASAHGEPLGEENVKALREKLGWISETAFEVPEEIYENYKAIAKKNAQAEEEWNKLFNEYCNKYPDMKKLWDQYHDDEAAKNLWITRSSGHMMTRQMPQEIFPDR